MSARVSTYDQAIEFLFGRINYERVQAEAYSTSDFKLDRMRRLLEMMGNPHDQIPAIHVAGTKGKGSTCSMLASVIKASGRKCGLYISPHISAFEERISVNGVSPTQTELVDLVNRLMPIVTLMDGLSGRMQPTYFELATALAWQYFVERDVDIAILEVGLGGRLDSTNLCRPLITVITNVSRDHTHVLGSTVHAIAYEKAGIIKAGVPVISGATHVEALAMVGQTCLERDAPLRLLGREIQLTSRRFDDDGQVEIDARTATVNWSRMPVVLRGPHQALNTTLALAVVDELRQQQWEISDEAVRTGLATVNWPARVERVSRRPLVVIDAAHNWESARALVGSLAEESSLCKRILVFAATKDKDVAGILRQLIPQFDTLILTCYHDNPRGVPLEELASLVEAMTTHPVHLARDPLAAWDLAKKLASQDDLIVVTGSFFLIAELRATIVADCQRAIGDIGAKFAGARLPPNR